MSTVPPPAPTFAAEPPAKSSSGCLKGLGCGCVVMLLLCCGGVGTVVWKFVQAGSQDPVVVARVGNEIATLDMPVGFNPTFSIDLTVPFVGHVGKAAVYTSDDRNILMLAELGEVFKEASVEDVAMQIQNASPQGAGEKQNLKVTNRHAEKMMIRGQEVTVAIDEAEDEQTKKQVWQVMAPFQGSKGVAFLFMSVPRDKYSMDEIKRILESIK